MLNSYCNNCQKIIEKKTLKKYAVTKIRTQDISTTVVSTTLWRPMELIDKTNQYVQKLYIEKKSAVSVSFYV